MATVNSPLVFKPNGSFCLLLSQDAKVFDEYRADLDGNDDIIRLGTLHHIPCVISLDESFIRSIQDDISSFHGIDTTLVGLTKDFSMKILHYGKFGYTEWKKAVWYDSAMQQELACESLVETYPFLEKYVSDISNKKDLHITSRLSTEEWDALSTLLFAMTGNTYNYPMKFPAIISMK